MPCSAFHEFPQIPARVGESAAVFLCLAEPALLGDPFDAYAA